MGDVILLPSFRGRRLYEAVSIARLSRRIWQARLAGAGQQDVSELIELRAIHKRAHAKFHAAEVREKAK